MSHESVYNGWMESTIFPLHQRVLSTVNIEPMVKALGTYGLQYIKEVDETFDSAGEHTTMESLVHQVTFRTLSSALFGPLFPAKEAYIPFLAFDQSFLFIAAGVPKLLIRKAIQSRNEIINMFERYLGNPNWELEASELIRQMTYSARMADQPLSPRDCAALLNTDFWASEGNMTWGLFWALNIPLHEKEGLTPLYAEVDAACSDVDRAGLVDFLVKTPLPLVQSTITETLRFTSSSFSIRTVVDDGARIGDYEFRKGDTLICNTRAVHLDENTYGADAATFRGDRFLDGTGKRAWLPFGGGVSQCEGRHLAIKGSKVLMALFLLEFDIKLDPNRPSTVDFDMSRVGGGIMHPTKPTHIIVTRRKRS